MEDESLGTWLGTSDPNKWIDPEANYGFSSEEITALGANMSAALNPGSGTDGNFGKALDGNWNYWETEPLARTPNPIELAARTETDSNDPNYNNPKMGGLFRIINRFADEFVHHPGGSLLVYGSFSRAAGADSGEVNFGVYNVINHALFGDASFTNEDGEKLMREAGVLGRAGHRFSDPTFAPTASEYDAKSAVYGPVADRTAGRRDMARYVSDNPGTKYGGFLFQKDQEIPALFFHTSMGVAGRDRGTVPEFKHHLHFRPYSNNQTPVGLTLAAAADVRGNGDPWIRGILAYNNLSLNGRGFSEDVPSELRIQDAGRITSAPSESLLEMPCLHPPSRMAGEPDHHLSIRHAVKSSKGGWPLTQHDKIVYPTILAGGVGSASYVQTTTGEAKLVPGVMLQPDHLPEVRSLSGHAANTSIGNTAGVIDMQRHAVPIVAEANIGPRIGSELPEKNYTTTMLEEGVDAQFNLTPVRTARADHFLGASARSSIVSADGYYPKDGDINFTVGKAPAGTCVPNGVKAALFETGHVFNVRLMDTERVRLLLGQRLYAICVGWTADQSGRFYAATLDLGVVTEDDSGSGYKLSGRAATRRSDSELLPTGTQKITSGSVLYEIVYGLTVLTYPTVDSKIWLNRSPYPNYSVTHAPGEHVGFSLESSLNIRQFDGVV